MAEDLDRKVAEALGIPIKTGGLCKADLPRLPKLFLVQDDYDKSLSLEKKVAFGRVEVVSRKWSPSTDAGDALAALEAYAVQRKKSVKFWFDIGARTGRLLHVCIISGTVAHDGDSFCDAACKAIIAASRAAT